MKCFLCNANMNPYFIKNDIKRSRHFVKCEKCGLVIDLTAYELDPLIRAEENVEFHVSYQGTDVNIVDPEWINRLEIQSIIFAQLFYEGIFPVDLNIVDYGCGDGKLSDYFIDQYRKFSGGRNEKGLLPNIKKYDKFMNLDGNKDYLSSEEMKRNAFDAVVTCSVFEHLLGGNDVEEIMGLLNENGIFCLHTLVCEEVPKDPNWYYLLPVHYTFWTNKAMEILYEKNGFKGCAYNVEGRMWLMYRNKEMFLKLKTNYKNINGTWIFSDHFVDYWKQKPYSMRNTIL